MVNDPWAQQVEAQQPSAKPEWLTEEIEESLVQLKYPLTSDGLLMLHQYSKTMLSRWKEEEIKLRKITVKVLAPDAQEGINSIELGNGYEAKIGKKFNYKLDSDNDLVWKGLEAIEKLGNSGKFVAERLVSWSPNFLLTEYRQLQEDAEKGSEFAKNALKEIEKFMTITEALPTLEVKEPKKIK